ncbi:MAG: hypothetical protein WDN27_01655 [Candidatus Saccharibacteria bacterium]
MARYDRERVPYEENARLVGSAGYSYRKLFKLAIDSVISFSRSPLYLVGYIGAVVLPVATVLGLGMVVNFFAGDPLHLHATGGAYLIVLIMWLVGVLLVSQGIIGCICRISIARRRPGRSMVVDEERSEDI